MSRLSRQRPDGSLEKGESYVPLQRLGTSLDIAHAAVFLFSPAATLISGQVIVVDGLSEDVRPLTLPYPESVLDPEGVAAMIRGKL